MGNTVELLFLMDITGSMQPHIDAVKKYLYEIIDNLKKITKKYEINLRMGFIGYRDHCDKDKIIEKFLLSDDIEELLRFIGKLFADGGGDEPEAVADAFHEAMNAGWTKGAYHLCVLIGDAPPHFYRYDGTQNPGDPCQCGRDVLIELKSLRKEMKISAVYTIACVPQIKKIWEIIAELGAGIALMLKNADQLPKILSDAFQHLVKIMDLDDYILKYLEDHDLELNHQDIANDATKEFGKTVTVDNIKERIVFLQETEKWSKLKPKSGGEGGVKKKYIIDADLKDIPVEIDNKTPFKLKFEGKNTGTSDAIVAYDIIIKTPEEKKIFHGAISIRFGQTKNEEINIMVPETLKPGNYQMILVVSRNDDKTELFRKTYPLVVQEWKSNAIKGDIVIKNIVKPLIAKINIPLKFKIEIENKQKKKFEISFNVFLSNASSKIPILSKMIVMESEEKKEMNEEVTVNDEFKGDMIVELKQEELVIADAKKPITIAK